MSSSAGSIGSGDYAACLQQLEKQLVEQSQEELAKAKSELDSASAESKQFSITRQEARSDLEPLLRHIRSEKKTGAEKLKDRASLLDPEATHMNQKLEMSVNSTNALLDKASADQLALHGLKKLCHGFEKNKTL